MKVRVKQHPEHGAKCGHVNAVRLVHKTDDVIILHLDMQTKYKGVSAYGGATDSGVQSIWIGGDEVQLELPEEFRHNIIFSEPSRYEIYVCIFRFQLVEEMTYEIPYDTATLWEA